MSVSLSISFSLHIDNLCCPTVPNIQGGDFRAGPFAHVRRVMHILICMLTACPSVG